MIYIMTGINFRAISVTAVECIVSQSSAKHYYEL